MKLSRIKKNAFLLKFQAIKSRVFTMSYLLNDEKGGDDKRNEYTWKMEYKCSQKNLCWQANKNYWFI